MSDPPRTRVKRASITMPALAAQHLASIPLDPALQGGAQNAVSSCLGVRAGERVVIITHREAESIAASILHVAIAAGASVESYVLSHDDAKNELFVARLIGRLEDADASFLVSQLDGIPVELRRRIVDVGSSRRRHGHMIGITRAMMEQSMRADYAEVARLSARLAARMRPGSTIEVTAPGGTALKVRLEAGCTVHAASGVQDAAGWTNLPGGEVFGVPSSVDGLLVPDGGVWLPDGTELASAIRMRLVFEKGSLAQIEGPAESVDKLTAALDAHPGARRAGQFGLGTNTGVLAPIGALLQDLKLPGVHLTLGHTVPELTGARFDSPAEVPLLVRRASAAIDGDPLLTHGRYPSALLA